MKLEALEVEARAAYVKANALRAGAAILFVFGAMVVASVAFEDGLLTFPDWLYGNLGLAGLAALVFSADSVTTPIPPDLILVVVAKTEELARHWAVLIPLAGALSATAGVAGWWLGKHLARHPRVAPTIARFQLRHGPLVKRYSRLTVALGAMTPLPFSITCWSAGALDMPLRRFLPLSLLRLPRYVIFYGAIVYADAIAQAL